MPGVRNDMRSGIATHLFGTLVLTACVLHFAPHELTAQLQRGQNAVAVRAVAAKSTLRPGDQLVIAVVYEHQPDFHTCSSFQVEK